MSGYISVVYLADGPGISWMQHIPARSLFSLVREFVSWDDLMAGEYNLKSIILAM